MINSGICSYHKFRSSFITFMSGLFPHYKKKELGHLSSTFNINNNYFSPPLSSYFNTIIYLRHK